MAKSAQHEPNPNPAGVQGGGTGEAPTDPKAGSEGDGADADGDGEAGDDAGSTNGKTYTQAELNAITAARVSKAEKSMKKRLEAEMKQQRERESMDEVERAKAEKADAEAAAEKRIAELEERVRTSRIREQLAGRVVNLDDAVRVMDDEFIDDDGKVNVDGFLESRPYLRAQTQGGHAKPGNPAGAKRLTREDIAGMTEAEVEERWDEVQAVLGGKRS